MQLNKVNPVLLLADHKWRDLPGLALLKVILEDEHKIPAVIVPYPMWQGAMLAFRPRAVCPTTMSGEREILIAHTARKMGSTTILLPTEGMPADSPTMDAVMCKFSDLSCVDLWLFWNEVVRDLMLEKGMLKPKQTAVTGVSRFDMYIPPYRNLLLTREALEARYALPKGRPIVSWTTNYGHAKFAKDPTFLIKDWTDRGIVKLGPPYDDAAKYAKSDSECQRTTFGLMRDVFKSLPDVNFIVKTHPGESLDIYKEQFDQFSREGFKNVFHVHREYISDVLNSADVHIHRYCTTGVEAWIMGIPTISLQLPSWHMNPESGGCGGEAGRYDDRVSCSADLVDRLKFYLSGGKPTPEQTEGRKMHLKRWLFRIDGRSTARQAAEIARFLNERKPAPKTPIALLKQFRGSALTGLRISLNRALGRPFDSPFWNGKHSEIDPLGMLDRFVQQHDVERWVQSVRTQRVSHVSNP